MTKVEVGQAIFNEIKEHVTRNGGSMAEDCFPSDFPISRRSVYNIRNGEWTEKLIEKLPFRVVVSYRLYCG